MKNSHLYHAVMAAGMWCGAAYGQGECTSQWVKIWEHPGTDGSGFLGLAYDEARQQLVRMTHQVQYRMPPETTYWDAGIWRVLSGSGPLRSDDLVYDRARQVMVMYLPAFFSDEVSETWEWDGGVWTRVATEIPEIDGGHALAFDESRGVTVLFGESVDSSTTNEVWEWDGGIWVERMEPGPSERWAHAMTYDSVRQEVLVFGGYSGGNRLNDLWAWDGVAWRLLSTDGPAGRGSAALAFDVGRGVAVLYGGESSTFDPLGDTWEWDGVSWREVETEGPVATEGPVMTYDPVRQRIVFASSVSSDDLWLFDGESWSPEFASVPTKSNLLVCYDRQRQALMAVDSVPYNSGYPTRTWYWEDGGWVVAGDTDAFSGLGEIVYDDARGAPVIHQEFSSSSALTLQWDGQEWNVVSVEPTIEASFAGMAFDSLRGVGVLVGGYSTSGHVETWEWDGSHWSLAAEMGPKWRNDSGIAFDQRRGVTVLNGGWYYEFEEEYITSDTWEWDGVSWESIDWGSSGERTDHAMTYDEAAEVVVMHGGRWVYEEDGLTRWWDGAQWQLVDASGPGYREDAGMAFDESRNATVLMGGYVDTGLDGMWMGDLWELRLGLNPEASLLTRCPAAGDATLTWSCAEPGGSVVVLYSRQEGETVVPDPILCAGLTLGLDVGSLQYLGRYFSDEQGGGMVTGTIPAGACGGFVQVVDVTRCRASAVVAVE